VSQRECGGQLPPVASSAYLIAQRRAHQRKIARRRARPAEVSGTLRGATRYTSSVL
jgi:hypothetical protein